jgi:hypothetical protein
VSPDRATLRNRPPVLLLLAATALAAAAAGCGLFATTEPERPDPGQSIPPSFVLPESTLAALERAVELREYSNYSQCLTDSVGTGGEEPGFYASFDPTDFAQWQSDNPGTPPPLPWTREREITFFPNFMAFNPNVNYEMTITPDEVRGDFDLDANTKLLNRRYRVLAAGIPIAAGVAGLTFVRVGDVGDWKIRFWEDLRDTSGVRTWGTARLNGQ